MDGDTIARLTGVVTSLFFSYAPVVKDWYDALTPTPKRLIMLGVLAVVTVGALFWTCRVDLSACVAANWEDYLRAFFNAVIANAATFLVTPYSPERRLVRAKANEKHMVQASVNVEPKPETPKP